MLSKQRDPIIVPLGEGIDIVFRHIPAGRFRLGQRGGFTEEEPVTEVEVPNFWMGETPVTQTQYRLMAARCLKELKKIKGNMGVDPSYDKGDMRPVEQVSWNDAMAIGLWLSSSALLPEGVLAGLPRAAMWEYACRAGSETEYWNGDGKAALAAVGWHSGNAGSESHPVAELPANGYGLYDMHGNIAEWCADAYDSVGKRRFIHGGNGCDSRAELCIPTNKGHRATKGGSYCSFAIHCRSASCEYPGRKFRSYYLGFRLCLFTCSTVVSHGPEIESVEDQPRDKTD